MELEYSRLLGLSCPFSENVKSYRLSENDSRPFFGTQNDILCNPKTTDIKFFMPRKFEVIILSKKIRGDSRPSEQIIYRNNPVGCPWKKEGT